MSIPDDRFDYGDVREVAFGLKNDRLFVCVHAVGDAERRVISLREAMSDTLDGMAETSSAAARAALATTDRSQIDAMTDVDPARRIAADPGSAPDMAPRIDVRAIRRAVGMTRARFAEAYEFSVRGAREWERGAKRPRGPARTPPRAIEGDPEGLGKALAAA